MVFNRIKNFILNNSNSYIFYKNKSKELELINKNNNQLSGLVDLLDEYNQNLAGFKENFLKQNNQLSRLVDVLEKCEYTLSQCENNYSKQNNHLSGLANTLDEYNTVLSQFGNHLDQNTYLIQNNLSNIENLFNQSHELINKLVNNDLLDEYLSYEFTQEFNIIKESGLFDEKWYLQNYPHVKYFKINPIAHYLLTWKNDMCDPNSYFSTKSYYLFYDDVQSSGMNPLVHYIKIGKNQGRQIFPSGRDIDKSDNQYIYNQLLTQQNVLNLRSKVNNGHKINVVFIFYKSYWVYDMLYYLFENDDLFNVTVVITPYMNNLTNMELEEYDDMYTYFKNRGFNIIKGYDEKTNKTIDLELVCSPDIVFYGVDWINAFPKFLRLDYISQSALICYVPYSFTVSQLLDSHFMNSELIRKSWKFFCPTEFHKQRIIDKNINNIDPGKLIVSYYPKIDAFFLNKTDDSKYWERSYDSKGNIKKRIIWAPHWTISNSLLNYSTFLDNYDFFYNYAKENPDIEWIFRPHPLLKGTIIQSGMMSAEETDHYYQKWEDLPNAKYYYGTDYASMYKYSDAMITDSGSFIGEYLLCNKPGLKLDRNTQKYNDFAQLMLNYWYNCNGDDFENIEKFINEIVISENDSLKKERSIFVRNHMLPKDNLTASEMIFNYIKECFSKSDIHEKN